MRRRTAVLAAELLVVVAVVLGGAGVSAAAPVSATATGVAVAPTGSCGPNPQLLLTGAGVGTGFGEAGASTVAGDPTPTIVIPPSPTFDDWSFDAEPFALATPVPPADGAEVAGYVVVGDPDLTVAVEWFALWRCGAGPDSGALLFTCVGPYGSCPRSVDEAQALEASVAPSSAPPGGTFLVTVQGCHGGLVAAGLFVPFDADPIVSTGPVTTGQVPRTDALVVPPGAEPTDRAAIVVQCNLDSRVVTLPVSITAPAPAPTPVPTAATEAAPTFTG